MSFKGYLKKIEGDYEFIKKFAKPSNNICGVELDDITYLPYKVLKNEVPNLFDSQEFEKAIYLVLSNFKKNITFKKIKRAKNNEKLLFLFWIKEQYVKINELENQYLSSPPDPKLIQAGIKELDILGDVNTIDFLAGGDILKWEKIRNTKYSDIFDKLLKNNIESRINKKLIEINKQR